MLAADVVCHCVTTFWWWWKLMLYVYCGPVCDSSVGCTFLFMKGPNCEIRSHIISLKMAVYITPWDHLPIIEGMKSKWSISHSVPQNPTHLNKPVLHAHMKHPEWSHNRRRYWECCDLVTYFRGVFNWKSNEPWNYFSAKHFPISVTGLTQIVLPQPQPHLIEEGTELQMKCETDNDVDSVFWFHDDELLQNGADFTITNFVKDNKR